MSGWRDLGTPELAGLYEVRVYGQSLPKYQACFTYRYQRGYEATPERAQYHFNGRLVGTGRAGYHRLIEALRQLPLGSIVIAYPHSTPRGGSFPAVDVHPFADEWSLLDQVARERRLKIVFSEIEPTPPGQ